ncbi:MAG: PAS domain S-box protein [Patescibacteria group bacterium]
MPNIFSPQNYFFNFYSIPEYAAGFVILSLGFFIWLKNYKQKINLAFFLFCFFSFGLFVCRATIYSSLNESTALFWSKICYIFIPLLLPACIFTIFSFIEIDKLYRKFFIFNFVSIILFILSIFSPFGHYFISGVKKYWWGYYPQLGQLGRVFMAIYILNILMMIILYLINYQKITVPIKKKQALYLLISIIAAVIAVVDFLPTLGISFYPIAYVLFFTFAVINTHAIIRYKAFSLTPQIATRQIINILGDSLILVGKEKKIEYANPAALRLLGYSEAELIGQPMEKITGKIYACEPDGWKELLGKGRMTDNNAKFKTKEGLETPVKISLSVIKDPAGDLLGIVCLAHDMTRTNKILEELTQKTSELEKIKTALESKEKELSDKIIILENFKKVMKGEF